MNISYKDKENFLKFRDEAKKIGKDKFIFKYKNSISIQNINLILENVDLEKKAVLKLPVFFNHQCVFTRKSFEQASSEILALYKSTMYKGNSCLILAAGLGVDDWGFSKSFTKVISVDSDNHLNDIVKYNFELLNIQNVERVTDTAESFVNSCSMKFDLIYIDPDRRDEDGKRTFSLSQHQPNVIQLMNELYSISEKIVIKCSPMYDVHMAIKELKNIVNIYAMSIKGEVKEVLIELDSEYNDAPKLNAIDFQNEEAVHEVFEMETTSFNSQKAEEIGPYLIDTGSSIVKLRKIKEYASKMKFKFMNENSPFLISDYVPKTCIGKVYEIMQTCSFNSKQIKLMLKELNIKQLNIKIRGIEMKSENLFKKFGVKEGGYHFLFITKINNEVTCILAKP